MKRPLKFLIFSVVTIHLLFFLFFDFKDKKESPPPKQSLIIHTYSPPKPTPKPVVRQAPQKPQIKKPSPPSNKGKIFNDLKEAFSKIETHAPPESTLTPPKKINSLQIDEEEKKREGDYFVLLSHALKEALELPELGEVKLELTVQQSGQVLKLRVLNAASKKNQRYLELQIPQLILPPFSEELKNERQHTFILTFCNET